MSKLNQIFSYLKRLFPKPKTELVYHNEFQLMVSVILSAQTTDIQVNKITNNIFKKIKTPQDIIKIGQKKLEKSISSINYYKTKSHNLYKLSNILVEKAKLEEKNIKKTIKIQEFYIPTQIEDLQKLPGIGEKTAKVIAHVLFNAPVIAVDTHVHRVTNRLGLVETKTPEQTSKLLEKAIPKRYKSIAHHSIILFGRYYCTARNPKCETCELKNICSRYKQYRRD